MKGGGVPVTERALIQRINRVLAKQDEMLKVTRGQRARADLGDWYVLDVQRNTVMRSNMSSHLSLEDYGRKLGALQPFEKLVREGGKP